MSGGGYFSAAGGALNVVGSISSGQSKAASLEAQAALADENAQVAVQAGDTDAFKQQVLARQRIGAAAAGYGGSGVRSNSGSVLAVLGSSAVNAEVDKQNILRGAQIKAMNYRNQAILDRSSAASAASAGYMQALMGVARVGAAFYTGGASEVALAASSAAQAARNDKSDAAEWNSADSTANGG